MLYKPNKNTLERQINIQFACVSHCKSTLGVNQATGSQAGWSVFTLFVLGSVCPQSPTYLSGAQTFRGARIIRNESPLLPNPPRGNHDQCDLGASLKHLSHPGMLRRNVRRNGRMAKGDERRVALEGSHCIRTCVCRTSGGQTFQATVRSKIWP